MQGEIGFLIIFSDENTLFETYHSHQKHFFRGQEQGFSWLQVAGERHIYIYDARQRPATTKIPVPVHEKNVFDVSGMFQKGCFRLKK